MTRRPSILRCEVAAPGGIISAATEGEALAVALPLWLDAIDARLTEAEGDLAHVVIHLGQRAEDRGEPPAWMREWGLTR